MIEIDNYTKRCKITKGGVKRFYLTPYVKHSSLQISSVGMVLTQFPTTTIYSFDCIGSYDQSSEVEDGAFYFNQSVSIQLSEVYNVLDIHDFLRQDYRVLVETNNNQTIMFGVYNGLECKVSNSSGSDKSEFNGFSLDFSGREEKTGLLVEDPEEIGLQGKLLLENTNYILLEDGGKIFL